VPMAKLPVDAEEAAVVRGEKHRRGELEKEPFVDVYNNYEGCSGGGEGKRVQLLRTEKIITSLQASN